MVYVPTDRAALDEYMGVWFRAEVPDAVELRSTAVIFRKELGERIESRRLVINHLENVRGCATYAGGALGSLGALKESTHPVIYIFMYHLGVVEAACALEVDVIGALDLVQAVGALDLVEVEAIGALDVVGLSLNILISISLSGYLTSLYKTGSSSPKNLHH
ncbi:hypothetical protein Tco_1382349 [Tanacetum coccineum]